MAGQDDTRQKRVKLLRRNYKLAVALVFMSIAAICVGSVAVESSGSKFPYNAGGAIIAGVMSLVFVTCPLCMYYAGKDAEETEECFTCCTIIMTIWFSITILAIPVGLGISGIYGLVECIKPNPPADGACVNNSESKFALSVVTIIISLLLMLLVLWIFLTCCCNAKTFGTPLLVEPSVRYIPNETQEQVRRDILAEFDSMRPTANDMSTNSLGDVEDMWVLSVQLPPSSSTRIEPSAPPLSWNDVTGGDRGDNTTGTGQLTTGDRQSDGVVAGATLSHQSYGDAPPTYEEATRGTIV